MEISLLVIRFLYLGTSVIYVVRNRAYWSSSDSSSKPKPGNSIVTTRTNTIKLFWLYSVFTASPLWCLCRFTICHKTEVVKNTLNPVWQAFKIPVRALCNGDYDRYVSFFRQQLLWQVKYNAATKTAIWIIQGSSFQYERHSKMPFSVIHAPLLISVSDGLFRLGSAKTLHGCLCLTFSPICLF